MGLIPLKMNLLGPINEWIFFFIICGYEDSRLNEESWAERESIHFLAAAFFLGAFLAAGFALAAFFATGFFAAAFLGAAFLAAGLAAFFAEGVKYFLSQCFMSFLTQRLNKRFQGFILVFF